MEGRMEKEVRLMEGRMEKEVREMEGVGKGG